MQLVQKFLKNNNGFSVNLLAFGNYPSIKNNLFPTLDNKISTEQVQHNFPWFNLTRTVIGTKDQQVLIEYGSLHVGEDSCNV